jgi:hypothetical protein
MEIPDYYRKFQQQTPEEEKPEKPLQPPEQKTQITLKESGGELFQANAFTIEKLKDWQDKTIYTLTGPVEDGIQHNVIVTVEENSAFNSLLDYADWNIRSMEAELKSCRLLKKAEKKLSNGLDAYEVLYSWYPNDDLRIYQQQLFILAEGRGYKLTASFTKNTRQTMGSKVEQMMLSFNPVKQQKS